MKREIFCDVCAADDWQDKSALLMFCLSCGLVRAKMDPTESELAAAYEKEYFFGGEYVDYIRDRAALEKNFSLRIQDLKKYLAKDSTIIEVGCSFGFFLNLCSKEFMKCLGYDITKEGIEYATKTLGQTAFCDSFLNYNGGTVDAVCLWDVMEHLQYPDKFIQKAAAVVRPGGVIAFSTGDIGSLVARLRGDKWRLVHPPTHLFYFDKNSATKLLEKHGFSIVSFTHKKVYRNIDSIFQQLLRGKDSGLVRWVYALFKKIKLTDKFIGLNLYDIMDVVAVKR